MRKPKPKYQHDCEACTYLGTIIYPSPLADGTAPFSNADLYYCGRRKDIMEGTLVARHSSDGPDYSSVPVSIVGSLLGNKEMATRTPALIAAYYFAKAKGLVD